MPRASCAQQRAVVIISSALHIGRLAPVRLAPEPMSRPLVAAVPGCVARATLQPQQLQRHDQASRSGVSMPLLALWLWLAFPILCAPDQVPAGLQSSAHAGMPWCCWHKQTHAGLAAAAQGRPAARCFTAHSRDSPDRLLQLQVANALHVDRGMSWPQCSVQCSG